MTPSLRLPSGNLEALCRKLETGGSLDRDEVTALVNAGSETGPRLRELMRRGTSESRWRSAEILGRIGDPSAAEDLCEMLRDEDFRVRSASCEALVLLGPKAHDTLVNLLPSLSGSARWWGASVISSVATPALRPHLENMLLDPDTVTRVQAARGLARLPGAAAPPALVAAVTDPSIPLRAAVAEALGVSVGAEAEDGLSRLCADANAIVRQAAAVALVGHSGEASIRLLIALLSDSDGAVCHRAADSLTTLAETSKSVALRAALPALRQRSSRWGMEPAERRESFRRALRAIEAATQDMGSMPIPGSQTQIPMDMLPISGEEPPTGTEPG